ERDNETGGNECGFSQRRRLRCDDIGKPGNETQANRNPSAAPGGRPSEPRQIWADVAPRVGTRSSSSSMRMVWGQDRPALRPSSNLLGKPPFVDLATWQAAREELLVREKAHTREGDAIAAARRRLPMTENCWRATVRRWRRPCRSLVSAFLNARISRKRSKSPRKTLGHRSGFSSC